MSEAPALLHFDPRAAIRESLEYIEWVLWTGLGEPEITSIGPGY